MDFVFYFFLFERPLLTRDWKSESVTDWLTDLLTGVLSRDTCVSKNPWLLARSGGLWWPIGNELMNIFAEIRILNMVESLPGYRIFRSSKGQREDFTHYNGWILGKVPNGLWPRPPRFQKIVLKIFCEAFRAFKSWRGQKSIFGKLPKNAVF